jgi:hypothetical protein
MSLDMLTCANGQNGERFVDDLISSLSGGSADLDGIVRLKNADKGVVRED